MIQLTYLESKEISLTLFLLFTLSLLSLPFLYLLSNIKNLSFDILLQVLF